MMLLYGLFLMIVVPVLVIGLGVALLWLGVKIVCFIFGG
jgi:hypothetical protein